MFRVTKFATTVQRSVHMSFWTADGDAIIIGNLHGKAIERINVKRDKDGKITNLLFDKSATLGLGSSTEMVVQESATAFSGTNAYGRPLVGKVIKDYRANGLSELTPNGVCKQNGCSASVDGAEGGRVNNVPICPIVSSQNLVYITLGGGGLLIADATKTPMKIVGEYGRNVVYVQVVAAFKPMAKCTSTAAFCIRCWGGPVHVCSVGVR